MAGCGREMAEATVQFRRQMAGACAGGLVNPKPPQLARDHAKDNVRAMREKERQLRGQRLIQASQRPAEPFKMRQFAEAKSRVFDPKGQHRVLLQPEPAAKGRGEAARRTGSPTSQEAACGADDGGGEIGLAEFEEQVADLIRKHGKKQTSFAKDVAGCPKYLLKMNEERERQRKTDEAERAKLKLPPGYRQLPAEEVQETLQALQGKREELEREFRRLPLKIETDSQKRRQKAVLDRIAESDRAIGIFSQPTVLVEV